MTSVLDDLTVRITDECTACGLCLQTCPENALLRSPKKPAVVDERCTGCLACIEVCPRDCIVELLLRPAPDHRSPVVRESP